MYRMLLRKLLEAFVTLFCATLIIFALIRLAPGDPVQLLLGHPGEAALSDKQAFNDRAAGLRAQLGLDQSMIKQYTAWIHNLVQLDLGTSIHTGRAVSAEIVARLPATAMLSAAALLIQAVLGLFFGTVSALKAGKSYDNAIRLACVALASTPAFVIGLFLLSLFAVTLGAYEISSEAGLSRLWLPALTLGLIGAPQLIRMVRANMLSEFGRIYVLSALSRGLSRERVVKHALRNALLPVITMIALSLTSLISGAVVIESIFSWPGIGKYALDSILLKDYPVIQGYALVMVSLVILIHLCVDVVYALIDPRIHRKREAGAEEHV
ncbi:Dipeptide transport system permease protein DppB [Paenibacillus plantiphilus]|uniref:Dipeptide transport system permease protein DppB n=1 Tax=Paenibacillus plantiphilus TaxID=2905650 RepID=A0ABN8G4C9_9BACL|nr:ABC transporter permease [Paenibacillus plantiphilus]CAH1195323.1 Dipeptide transport system permease protein DppB [Paenibacillus plantiphilus]